MQTGKCLSKQQVHRFSDSQGEQFAQNLGKLPPPPPSHVMQNCIHVERTANWVYAGRQPASNMPEVTSSLRKKAKFGAKIYPSLALSWYDCNMPRFRF